MLLKLDNKREDIIAPMIQNQKDDNTVQKIRCSANEPKREAIEDRPEPEECEKSEAWPHDNVRQAEQMVYEMTYKIHGKKDPAINDRIVADSSLVGNLV